MTTRTRAVSFGAHSNGVEEPDQQAGGGWLAAFAAVGGVGLGVLAFYLWIYRSKGLTVPIGWDTSRYLWRTALAQALGLPNMQGAVPSFVNTDPSRPAFPVVAGTLTSLLQVGPFRLASVLPSVTVAAVALAAGAFVSVCLRRPAWELTVVAVAVGTSGFIVRMLAPESYQDNLFAAAVFMAAGIPIALSVWHRRAFLPAIALFGAGGIVHWAFFAFMVATVLLTALAYAPASWRRWRTHGRGLLDTPSARLGGVAAGGAAFAAATIYGVLGSGARTPRLSEAEFAKKLRADLPRYRFPLTLPAAAVGAASLTGRFGGRGHTGRAGVDRAGGRERFLLVFLLAWCGVALAGYLGFEVFGLAVPAHRFLAFALAVPVLAVLGVLWVGRLVATRWRPLGAAVVVLAVGASAYTSHLSWMDAEPWITVEKTDQAVAAAAYLEAAGIAPDRPVVFILIDRDPSFVALMSHMLRSVLPGRRIPQAYFYAGSPQDYLARRPTPDATGRPGALSSRYFANMAETYDRDPVALILEYYNDRHYGPWALAHPDSVVAPRLAVVAGPVVLGAAPSPPSPVAPYRVAKLGLIAVGSLAILGAVGLGWALLLIGPWLRRVEALAVSPAVGIAVLVVGGVIADRLGFRLQGPAGALTLVAIGLTGWVAQAIARRRSRATPASPSVG